MNRTTCLKIHRFAERASNIARAALAVAAITVTMPAAKASAQALEKTSIEIVAVRDAQLGSQVAISDALELFKDEGLDVTVNWTQSGADVITIMAGGSQYLATAGAFNQLVLSSQNVPVKTISALADMTGTQGLGLRPGLKISSPKELEGKKFSFTQGTPNLLILARLADRYGVDMNKIELTNLDPSEGLAAVSRGDLDGFLGPQPFLYRLTTLGGSIYATGKELNFTDTPEKLSLENQLLYVHSVMLGSEEWIKANPNTTKAVLRALNKATDIINNDRPRAVEVMKNFLKLDAAAIEQMMNQNSYSLAVDASLDKSIRFLSDWGMNIKRLPKAITPEEVLDLTLLKEVDPSLVSWPAAK